MHAHQWSPMPIRYPSRVYRDTICISRITRIACVLAAYRSSSRLHSKTSKVATNLKRTIILIIILSISYLEWMGIIIVRAIRFFRSNVQWKYFFSNSSSFANIQRDDDFLTRVDKIHYFNWDRRLLNRVRDEVRDRIERSYRSLNFERGFDVIRRWNDDTKNRFVINL